MSYHLFRNYGARGSSCGRNQANNKRKLQHRTIASPVKTLWSPQVVFPITAPGGTLDRPSKAEMLLFWNFWLFTKKVTKSPSTRRRISSLSISIDLTYKSPQLSAGWQTKCLYLSKMYALKATPQCDGKGGVLERWLGPESVALMNEISSL